MEQKGPHSFKKTNMVPTVLLPVCMFLLFNIIPGASSDSKPITCEAGTFTNGEPASIDCNFRTNITASELGLSVTKYPSDAPKGDTGKDVLLCQWDKEQNKYDCSIEMANYVFDNILTDHLVVRIPAVNFEQAGVYMCFFVSTEEIDPYPCELRVQARPESTSTGEPEKSQALLPIVLPCVIVVLVGVCIVGIVLFMRIRRANRSETTEPLLPDEKQQVDKLAEDFQLSQTSLQNVVNAIQQEMQKGLDNSTHRSANTGMFRTCVSPLPTASESGYIMVFQLRSDQLTIQFVILQSPEVKCPSREFTIPRDVDTAKELFDFIAGSAEKIVDDNIQSVRDNRHLKKKKFIVPVAFVFAFPCKHETLSKAHLTKWTKEFNCKGVVRKDIKVMLQQAFRKIKRLRSLEIVAIMNDTVSTLVSAACLDPKCKLALYVGNGLNACYVENFNSTGAEAEPHSEVINTELGGLWKKADLEYLRTLYDKELDEYSADPGSQIYIMSFLNKDQCNHFYKTNQPSVDEKVLARNTQLSGGLSLEKMVSWMYMGEIVRLVLKRLKHDGVVFRSLSGDCELFTKHSFFPENVIIIEGDTEAPFSKTETILNGLGIELCTDKDINIVRDVCRLVCERSAFLTAAGLAALINHVNEPEVTVAVDGILCLSYPRFRDMMHRKTLELVKSGLTFSLVSPSCDRSIGAARIAAASLRLRNTKKSNK